MTFTLASETHIGIVALKVADLKKMTDFYQNILGMDVLKEIDGQTYLGTRTNQEVFVVLRQINGKKRENDMAGLEHFAIVLPNEIDLGAALVHFNQAKIATSAFENGYSRGFSFTDPENNGIDLVIDKETEDWHQRNAHDMHKPDWNIDAPKPLDENEILKKASGTYSELPAGSIIGHIQLKSNPDFHVAEFYTDVLGFAVKPDSDDQNDYLAAGSDHHHTGVTLQNIAGLKLPTVDSYGLDYISYVLPKPESMDDLVKHINKLGNQEFEYTKGQPYLEITDPIQTNIIFTIA